MLDLFPWFLRVFVILVKLHIKKPTNQHQPNKQKTNLKNHTKHPSIKILYHQFKDYTDALFSLLQYLKHEIIFKLKFTTYLIFFTKDEPHTKSLYNDSSIYIFSTVSHW